MFEKLGRFSKTVKTDLLVMGELIYAVANIELC